MKAKILSLIVPLAMIGSSLPAANIAFVSFHPADGTPDATAAGASFTNAPDVGYTKLLKANGHNVTRFVTVEGIDTALLSDGVTLVLDAIKTNDLVIISRSVPSGHYDGANETAAWAGVTKPVISMNGYINRNSRLGFNNGTTIPDANSTTLRLKVNFPNHPIFAGVSVDSSGLMVNPYSTRQTFTNTATGVTTLLAGISVETDAIVAGGSVLATIGTVGDGAFGGTVIAEFPAGTTTARSDVLAGKRLVFLTGTREATPVPADGAGIFDLQPDGATLLLNAVTYLTTVQPPIAPQMTPISGATNLVAGDFWTFNPSVYGAQPITYQWYKDGVPYSGGTASTLAFTSLTTNDAGAYQLYATNAAGWSTSLVASLSFHTFGTPSITSGMISYWPLDAALGTKTVDLVSGYDLNLVNLTGADVVAGKWGNAFQFNGTNSILMRVDSATEDLPIYKNPDFTLSMWVNGLPQTDRRVFAEGNTTNGNTMFDLGTHNGAADGTVDIFIRTDGGTASPNHAHSLYTAFDSTWHNVVYVQRDIGGGNAKAQLWVDGQLDTVAFTPIRSVNPNTTAIGALQRSGVSAWFAGMVDEVATWNRALSPEEVGILQVTAITNPPSRLQPLAINSFKADLPAIVNGGATTLRWDVSKDASQVTISPLGDVTAITSVGVGSRSITQTVATTYVLTVNRGVDSLSATTSVAVVDGVAAGWTLLDNFDQAQLGNLFASGYWNDTSGNGGQVVLANGNRALKPTSAGISFLNLKGLSIQETQACTLFFRLIPGADNAVGVTNIVGLTDKSQRSYADEFSNIGTVVYPTAFTNIDYGIETNAWYLGVRNYPGSGIEYLGNQPEIQTAFEAGAVYNVWINMSNAPSAEFAYDPYSVYVQKEGGDPRKIVFQDYYSDRDFTAVDPVLGGFLPVLDKLVVIANSATVSCIFDDFYLSRGAYNDTVPKAYTIVQPQPGPLSLGWVGNQLQISWTDGTLQSSTNAAGPYVDVPSNPTSPYLVTPAGNQVFYRSRQ